MYVSVSITNKHLISTVLILNLCHITHFLIENLWPHRHMFGMNCQPRTRCSRYINLGNFVCYFLESTLKIHHLLIISMVFVDHVIPNGLLFFHVSLFSKNCRPLAYPNIQLLVRPGEVPCWVETNIEENFNFHPFGEEICAEKMCWNPSGQETFQICWAKVGTLDIMNK